MSCHVMSKLNWGCWASKEKEKLSEFKRKPKSKFIYVYFLIPSVFFLVQFKEPLSPFFFFLLQLVFTHSQAQCPSSYLSKTKRRDLVPLLKHTSMYIKWKNPSDFPSEAYSRSLSVTVAHSPAFLTDDSAPSRVRLVTRSTPSPGPKRRGPRYSSVKHGVDATALDFD